MPEAADHQESARVAGDRPARGAHGDRLGDAGPIRQRPGPGVRRSLRPRLLAAAARQVGALPQHQRRRGEFFLCADDLYISTRGMHPARLCDRYKYNNGHVADVTFLPFSHSPAAQRVRVGTNSPVRGN